MKRSIQKVLAEKLELRVPDSARLLTTSEVARLLRLTHWTLINWRRERRGPPFVKLSKSVVRYPRRSLEYFLRQRLWGAIPAGGGERSPAQGKV
jgi:hypothetical protein